MEVIPDGMTLPSELQFKVSQLETNKIGVWTRKQVNKGRLYGPFKGERKPCAEVVNDTYSWQIVGPKGRRLFCIDASDPTKGNWMRYVKTAPNRELHNLHPVQHKKKIYYKVLTTLKKDTELLCWYDGATNPEIQESELLPMPVLEKMDLTKDEVCKVSRRVPSPLELMPPAGVSEGLEPPMISPAYPDSHPSGSAEKPLSTIQTMCALTEENGSSMSQDDTVAIQAPDISSSGELVNEAEGVSDLTGVEKEPVTSSDQPSGVKLKLNPQTAKSAKHSKNYKKVKKKASLKPWEDPLIKSVLLGGKATVEKVKSEREMVLDPFVIGPDSVISYEDGSEKYQCRLCGKLCKYPVGLKIHLRTSHCYVNVQIRGIAKKPWARGISLKRERDEREATDALFATDGGTPDQVPIETWASVDRCLVQSALEKLQDRSGEVDAKADHQGKSSEPFTAQKSLSDSSPVAIGNVILSGNEDLTSNVKSDDKVVNPGEELVPGNMNTPQYLVEDSKSVDKTKVPRESKKHSRKHKRKKNKDPFNRKGSKDKDIAVSGKRTKVKDSFARKENQTIIALSELSISESSDSDLCSKDLSQKGSADSPLLGGVEEDRSAPKCVGNKTLQDGESPKKEKSSNILPKKYSCPLCHQAFAYQVWMDRHLKMHSESRTGHSCNVCNLKFFSKKDLILHQSLHTGEGTETGNDSGEKPVDFSSQEVIGHIQKNSTNEETDVTPGKAKENLNLAKLVASLQKSQEKSPAAVGEGKALPKEEKKPKKRRRVGQTSGITKKYLCRLCLATFANPSNRCRHMRLVHGISQKKKPPKTEASSSSSGVDSEKGSKGSDSGSVLTSTDSRADMSSDTLSSSPLRSAEPRPVGNSKPQRKTFPVKSPMTSSTKKTSPSLKKVSPHVSRGQPKQKCALQKAARSPKKGSSSKRVEVPVLFGYWKKSPRTKIIENHVEAHVRKASKRRNVMPFDPVQEFPRTPSIYSPWDGLKKPTPYVPGPRPAPSLGSFVLHSVVPTDLSQRSSPKLPQNIEPEKCAEIAIHNFGSVGASKTSHSPPMDLTNENYFQHGIGIPENARVLVGGQSNPVNSSLSAADPPNSQIVSQDDPKALKTTSKMSSKKSSKFPLPVNPMEWHFTCNICSCNFASIREVSGHVIAHAEDFPYKCEFCMHVYALVEELQAHKESRHNVKTMYACSVCKKEFAYLSNLENHQVEGHPGVRCTFEDNLSNVLRPQNFTDPTKAFNLPSKTPAAKERVSYLKEEMSKLLPLKRRNSTQEKDKPPVNSPRKTTPEKGLLFNPQRNHPFEQRRRIGYLSMLSDPRNQKQLGSQVSNVCTKCLQEFKETSAFHIHIMECASMRGDLLKKGLKAKEGDSSSSAGSSKAHLKKPKNIIGKVSKKSSAISRRGRVCSSRQKPGTVAYDPQKYLRAKTTIKSAFDDIHSCVGCGKKFYFINQLERHMKMCPNREKLINASKSTVALALRKRPRANTMQHKCTNCEKHFTYLGSLEKHLLMCTRRDVKAV